MPVFRKEAAFLTPSLIVFYVYLFILTVVVSFLAPLFATQNLQEVSDGNDTPVRIMRKVKGFLHKIEEGTCFIKLSEDDCNIYQKNTTNIMYPTTIIIVRISVCCPFVLVIVLCVYWEERRCRNVSAKIITVIVICITFESLHTLGFLFYPIFIGSVIGFKWNDLEFGFFIGIGNIVFVWIWLFGKIYITKKTHMKRRYKYRIRKSDPVFTVDNFIFIEERQKKRSSTVSLVTTAERASGPKNKGPLNFKTMNKSNAPGGSINKSFSIEEVPTDENKVIEDKTNESRALECVTADSNSVNASFASEGAASHLTEFATENDGQVLDQQLAVVDEHQIEETGYVAHLKTLRNESTEAICIKSLIENLWSPQLVGLGQDSRVPRHSKINVKTIQHISNYRVWNHYEEKKKEIKNYATDYFGGKLFSPGEFGTDINVVKTDNALDQVSSNTLKNKTDKDINEHYLLHGTDVSNVPSISQNGFDMRSSHRTMLGKGLYFTDHPVKADQYTGSRRIDGSRTACCMILARVLLGNSVITKVRNADLMSASSTPCKICLSLVCSHDNSEKFDSLIFDGGLFREYVVYENFMAFPEYVIYYDRVSHSV